MCKVENGIFWNSRIKLSRLDLFGLAFLGKFKKGAPHIGDTETLLSLEK